MNIYFHHFHKCAGSSVYNFLNNNFNLISPNNNGNVVDSNNIAIPLHLFTETELSNFLSKNNNKSFCFEWGIPNLDLIGDLDFYKVTVIREPVERLISNYKFDYINSSTALSFKEYVSNIAIPFWSGNYYWNEIQTSLLKNGYSVSNLKVCSDFIFNSFDEIWLMENGSFNLLKGDGILGNSFSKDSIKNATSKFRWFKKKPTIPKNVEIYCELDIEIYKLLKNRFE